MADGRVEELSGKDEFKVHLNYLRYILKYKEVKLDLSIKVAA